MIRVAVIEDQEQTRKMLAILINGSDGYECVAALASSEEALPAMRGLDVDVALVDIHMPGGMSGIECVTKLKLTNPGVAYVICTSLEDSDTIFHALQAGAVGYITKATPPAKILEAITDAATGGAPMSSQIARKVIAHFHAGKPNTELAKLTAREQELLQLLSKGFRYKEIAALLSLNIETVRKHIHNIYEKLQVSSRTDALNKVYPKG